MGKKYLSVVSMLRGMGEENIADDVEKSIIEKEVKNHKRIKRLLERILEGDPNYLTLAEKALNILAMGE